MTVLRQLSQPSIHRVQSLQKPSTPYAKSLISQPARCSQSSEFAEIFRLLGGAVEGGIARSQSFWSQIATVNRKLCTDSLPSVGTSATRSLRTCKSTVRRRAKKPTRVRPRPSHVHQHWASYLRPLYAPMFSYVYAQSWSKAWHRVWIWCHKDCLAGARWDEGIRHENACNMFSGADILVSQASRKILMLVSVRVLPLQRIWWVTRWMNIGMG